MNIIISLIKTGDTLMSNIASKNSRIGSNAVDELLERIPNRFIFERRFLLTGLTLWILAISSGGIVEVAKQYLQERQMNDAFKVNTSANSAKLVSSWKSLRIRPLPERFETGALENQGNVQCINGPADLDRALQNKPAGWDKPYRYDN